MEQANNTFNKGLQMDSSPLVQGNDSLSNALNATIITQNGNEIVLQNDMGNAKINRAFLPPGYEPVGVKEYGGIIYIASYNPMTGKCQIGSFPSPQRYFTENEDTTNNNIDLIFDTYTKENFKWLKEDFKLFKVTNDNLYAGDEFAVIINDTSLKQTLDLTKDENVSLYNIQLGVLNQYNEFMNINEASLMILDDEVDPLQTENDNEVDQTRLVDKIMRTYLYKSSSPLYVKTSVNHTQKINYNFQILPLFLNEESENKSFTLIISGELWYNNYPITLTSETFQGIKLFVPAMSTQSFDNNCYTQVSIIDDEYTNPENINSTRQKVARSKIIQTEEFCNEAELIGKAQMNNTYLNPDKYQFHYFWQFIQPNSVVCTSPKYQQDEGLYKVNFKLEYKNLINSSISNNLDYYITVPLLPDNGTILLDDENLKEGPIFPLYDRSGTIKNYLSDVYLENLSSKGSLNLNNLLYYFINIVSWTYHHSESKITVGLVKYIPPEGGPDHMELTFKFTLYDSDQSKSCTVNINMNNDENNDDENNNDENNNEQNINIKTILEDDEDDTEDINGTVELELHRIYLVQVLLTAKDSNDEIFEGIENVNIADEFVITTNWNKFNEINTHEFAETIEINTEDIYDIQFSSTIKVTNVDYGSDYEQYGFNENDTFKRTIYYTASITPTITKKQDIDIYPEEIKNIISINSDYEMTINSMIEQNNNNTTSQSLAAGTWFCPDEYRVTSDGVDNNLGREVLCDNNFGVFLDGTLPTPGEFNVYYSDKSSDDYVKAGKNLSFVELYNKYKDKYNSSITNLSQQLFKTFNLTNFRRSSNRNYYLFQTSSNDLETINEGMLNFNIYYFDNNGELLLIPTFTDIQDPSYVLKYIGLTQSRYYVFKKSNKQITLYKSTYKNTLENVNPEYQKKELVISDNDIKLNKCTIKIKGINKSPEYNFNITIPAQMDSYASLPEGLGIIKEQQEGLYTIYVPGKIGLDITKLYTDLGMEGYNKYYTVEHGTDGNEVILKIKEDYIKGPTSSANTLSNYIVYQSLYNHAELNNFAYLDNSNVRFKSPQLGFRWIYTDMNQILPDISGWGHNS